MPSNPRDMFAQYLAQNVIKPKKVLDSFTFSLFQLITEALKNVLKFCY